MTVVARRIRATPVRTTADAWTLISELVAAADESMRSDLDSAGNTAAMLIGEEHTKANPIVLTGCGPQVRIYTLHGMDAIDGANVNEQALQIDSTGEWNLSLPAAGADLELAAAAVSAIDHVTVYEPTTQTEATKAEAGALTTRRVAVDLTALED